jgi:Xaa-Pro aminopeptidase
VPQLTADYCRARRERLIEQTDVDLIVITSPCHLLYLSGFYASPLTLGAWGRNFLIIEADTGQAALLAHSFVKEAAHAAHVDDVQVWQWYDSASEPAAMMFPEAVQQLNELLQGGHTVGVERGHMPLGANISHSVDITPTLLTMRRSKWPDELAMVSHAITAIEKGHAAALKVIEPGLTEIDVYNAIQSAIVAAAGEPILPLGDYVGGKRVSGVGGPPTDRVLQAGEVMILDVFPIIGGYRGDITATIPVSGSLPSAQAKAERALHAALNEAEARLKAGAAARTIYDAVKHTLDGHGYEGAFPHHAGHGLGLGHPEAPYLVPGSGEVLQAGDVITLEPGVYGTGFGARIEHNYLITGEGFERLSDHRTQFAGG